MDHISVVALFCEDIREEKTGQDTIVGVLPDNVAVASFPAAFPKLAIYVRIHLSISHTPESITTRLVGLDGKEIAHNDVDRALINSTLAGAERSGAPHLGIISRFLLSPFPVNAPGRLQVITKVDGKDYIAGILNVRNAQAGQA